MRLLAAAALVVVAAAESGAQAAPVARVPRITGDVSARAEFIGNEFFADSDATSKDGRRFRVRARVRISLLSDTTTRLRWGARLSTGDAGLPASAWASFSNDLRRFPLSLDRAYVRYRASPNLSLRLGVDSNPVFTPTEMVWDADVQTAGLAVAVNVPRSGLTLHAGQFSLRELRSSRATNQENSFLFVQGVSWRKRSEMVDATVGASFYGYGNANEIGRSEQAGEFDADVKTNRFDPRGRTIADPQNAARRLPTDLFSRYRIMSGGARIRSLKAPWSFAVDMARNAGARVDSSQGVAFASRQNSALGVAATYGSVSREGDWSLQMGFYRIEADAVLAAFNNDDLQQTNVRSIPVELQVELPDGLRLVWDTYFQKKLSTALASSGGVVNNDNALKVRSRVTLRARF